MDECKGFWEQTVARMVGGQYHYRDKKQPPLKNIKRQDRIIAMNNKRKGIIIRTVSSKRRKDKQKNLQA